MCEAPPLSQMRIVDFALPVEAAAVGAACTRRDRSSPAKPRPPATKKVRRLSAVRMTSWPRCMVRSGGLRSGGIEFLDVQAGSVQMAAHTALGQARVAVLQCRQDTAMFLDGKFGECEEDGRGHCMVHVGGVVHP